MPMKLLTLLQFIQIFVVYMLVVTVLPAWVFHRKLSGFSFALRLLFYYIMGNFFVINLVLILQLVHISNRLTLMAFTLGMAGVLGVKNNGLQPLSFVKNQWKYAELLLDGRMRIRTLLLRLRKSTGRKASRFFHGAKQFICGRILDLFFLGGVTGLFFWRFGRNLLNTYGYTFSDIIVHNYWINALGEGNLFVSGVYPFGFHCVIYYLHDVFGIDNYVLLRVFWLVQTLMIFYSLLFFLKECCKNRYLPYLGMLLYILGTFGILSGLTYERFFGSLPQEFGMIFILPSIQFLFAFFRIKKEELSGGTVNTRRSLWCLAGFAMSFSITLAVHFYDTIIVGLLCIGGILGYGFRLFRKEYFVRVMVTGIIGVLVAVLPMAAAVAQGKPLQGSLRWGLSVMGANPNNVETESEELQTSSVFDKTENETETIVAQPQHQKANDEGSQQMLSDSGTVASEGPVEAITRKVTGFCRRIVSLPGNVNKYVSQRMQYNLLNGRYQLYGRYLMLFFYVLPCLGLIFLLVGTEDRNYGARLFSVGGGLWMLGILMAADYLGLPSLMDTSRGSIYTAMFLMAAIVMMADGLLYGATCFIRVDAVRQAVALPVLAAVIWLGADSGILYDVPVVDAYGTNEAVLCLTNIIRQFRDKTWTICSANDELRMVDDHGYHYELTDFLRGMEKLDAQTTVSAPTLYVFFFIEKIPIDYSSTAYEGSGQKVSEEGAEKKLPMGGGLSPYQGENRWIMMSRMYYWAQKFHQMYPNEFKVYFENDNFVCYYVEQNPYALYNFAIDYGYNTGR